MVEGSSLVKLYPPSRAVGCLALHDSPNAERGHERLIPFTYLDVQLHVGLSLWSRTQVIRERRREKERYERGALAPFRRYRQWNW